MTADAEPDPIPFIDEHVLTTLLNDIDRFELGNSGTLGGSRLVSNVMFAVRPEVLRGLAAEVRRLRAEKSELMSEVVERVECNVKLAYGIEPMTDEAIAKLCEDVMAAPDVDDAHYELVMPFVVCESNGGPYDDEAYCAGWEAGTIDVKLMALSAFGQSASDIVCREANWPQVSLILMKHGWNVDESSMSIADGWVSVKLVGF